MEQMKKLAPVCLALTLLGCSETRKLDTMRDSTVEMNGTTKELLDTTKQMNTTTKSLAKSTDDLSARTAQMDKRTEELNTTTQGMAKETGEMNKTTKELAATSKDLNKTTNALAETSNDMRDRMARMETSTEEMKKLTQSLNKQSAEIYDASRQAVAMSSRRDLLESVYKAESGGQKAVFAALYFKAFEYQLWMGAEKDAGEEKRLALMGDATREFFKAVQEFADEDPSLEPDPIAKRNANESLSAPKNKQATFNALALTLHESNSKQKDMLKEHKDLKLVTMLSLIVDSLAAEKSPVRDLPEHQKVVLENKELALKLLQARHNILLAVFLKDALNKSIAAAAARPEGAKPSLTDSVKGMFRKWIAKGKAAANIYLQPKTTGNPYVWELNLDQYNMQQTRLLNAYLNGCLQTRTALSEIGVTPAIHPHLATIFKGLKLIGGAKGAGDLQKAQTDLNETVEKVRALEISVTAPASPAPVPEPTAIPAPQQAEASPAPEEPAK